MPDENPSVWDVGAGAALLGLLFTGTWAELDRLGPLAWGLGFGLLGTAWLLLRFAGGPRFARPEFGINRATLISSILLLLPLGLAAAAAWTDEFPFSGDHDHHLLAIDSALRFWTENWAYLLVFLALVGVQFTRWRRDWWPALVFGLMILASYRAAVPAEYFSRYPATLYSLAAPLHGLAMWVGAKSVWPYDRIVNLLAPVAWLFILRPGLFGRSTTAGWLPGAVFLLASREPVYYINSIYLEAWPFVLALTAFEALFEREFRPWLAPLLLGVACAFKETTALVFLAVGVASLWRCRRSPKQLAAVLGAGTVSVIPFLVYSCLRLVDGVSRNLEIAPLTEAWTKARLGILEYRLFDQFGTTGLVLLAAVAATTMVYVARFGRDRRAAALMIHLAGWAQLGLFFFDKISLAWPGYARLLLMPMLCVLAPLNVLAGRSATATAVALALGQASPLGHFLVSAFEPSFGRNFTEDFSSPIHVPVRELVGQADLPLGSTVRWLRDNDFQHPRIFPLVYRDLFARYRWETLAYDARADQCRCAPGLALLVSTTTSRNLHARLPYAPHEARLDRIGADCRAEIAASCRCVTAGVPADASLCTSF